MTVTLVAPATTWLLVSTSPLGVMIMPVPAPSTSALLIPLPPLNTVVSIDTTAGSTWASTAWMSVGCTRALRLGKNCSTTVCCDPSPTARPATAPTSAASTAVTMVSQTQLRRVRVWTTRWVGGDDGERNGSG